MKRIWIILPMFALAVITGCSEEPAQDTAEDTEVKEEPKPLIEREPEVREYMEVMNELVDEYLTLGETVLTTLEKLDSGDLGTLETIGAVAELSQSWSEIEKLNQKIEENEGLKAELEKKLNSDDIMELASEYTKTMQRFVDFSKRLEESSLNKYVSSTDSE